MKPVAPLLLTLFLLMNASKAQAKCTGETYKIIWGAAVTINKISDGGSCTSKFGRSLDPIYGNDIVSRPKHGTLTSPDRTTVIYRPNPGYKGEDAYAFQWIGKQGGVTPTAFTVNVRVAVQ